MSIASKPRKRAHPWATPEPDPYDDRRLVVLAVSVLLCLAIAVAAVGITAAAMP